MSSNHTEHELPRSDRSLTDRATLDHFFENLSHNAPELVTRKKLCELTSNIFSEKTLANLDSLGEGIMPRFRIGGKVVYPKEPAIDFFKQRCRVESNSEGGHYD